MHGYKKSPLHFLYIKKAPKTYFFILYKKIEKTYFLLYILN